MYYFVLNQINKNLKDSSNRVLICILVIIGIEMVSCVIFWIGGMFTRLSDFIAIFGFFLGIVQIIIDLYNKQKD